ncbi:MAG: hypothetical protein EBR82_28975 [Caulobacteraceae bacterium]|nr:hypothetical protein [Caulobacteraceae bacterium]
MTTAEADIIVLEALRAQASGLRRNAKNPLVGARAGLVEEEMNARLAKLEAIKRRQSQLALEEVTQQTAA